VKTGLFGGTFDPVHRGHYACAKAVMSEFALDRIIFIPSKSPVHKNNASASADDRAAMISLALAGHSDFECSRIEIDREGPSYSVITAQDMVERYPDDLFFFILGVDSFNTLHMWKDPEELARLVSFIVMNRDGAECEGRLVELTGAHIASNARIDIRSSDIRTMIAEGRDVSEYLHPDVLAYIREKRLYHQ
jgi:nicotinate-nucleotide adenylyltransferase